jgi:hypothetical protein
MWKKIWSQMHSSSDEKFTSIPGVLHISSYLLVIVCREFIKLCEQLHLKTKICKVMHRKWLEILVTRHDFHRVFLWLRAFECCQSFILFENEYALIQNVFCYFVLSILKYYN